MRVLGHRNRGGAGRSSNHGDRFIRRRFLRVPVERRWTGEFSRSHFELFDDRYVLWRGIRFAGAAAAISRRGIGSDPYRSVPDFEAVGLSRRSEEDRGRVWLATERKDGGAERI